MSNLTDKRSRTRRRAKGGTPSRQVRASSSDSALPVSASGPPGRPFTGRPGGEADGIYVKLTAEQVNDVVRSACDGGALSILVSASRDARWKAAASVYGAQIKDPKMSRSLLNGLVVLGSLPDDGSPMGIVQLADTLGMNSSTVHRYAQTLLAVGLVERDPGSRKYRRAVAT